MRKVCLWGVVCLVIGFVVSAWATTSQLTPQILGSLENLGAPTSQLTSAPTRVIGQIRGMGTAEDAVTMCESPNEVDRLICLSVLQGMYFMAKSLMDVGGAILPGFLCIPGGASPDQLRQVFLKYERDHPRTSNSAHRVNS
jgi:hypothetical protein